jgi:hypothetical protein
MTDDNKIYGMLYTKHKELPPETEEQRLKHEEINRELKGLAHTGRFAYDWFYHTYDNTNTGIRKLKPWETQPDMEEPTRFESGDLVKIFKTVSDGDVHWEGTVKYDRSQYHHGYQVGMEPEEWVRMFYDALPTRVERNGQVVWGALEPYAETGTEGEIWSVHIYGKAGYDGLFCLEEGDKLTVYSEVRDGEVEWEGRLAFGPEQPSKLNWMEIMRQTEHIDTQKWLQMSWNHMPVVVTPKPG